METRALGILVVLLRLGPGTATLQYTVVVATNIISIDP
jgi:hypothetical protein